MTGGGQNKVEASRASLHACYLTEQAYIPRQEMPMADHPDYGRKWQDIAVSKREDFRQPKRFESIARGWNGVFMVLLRGAGR